MTIGSFAVSPVTSTYFSLENWNFEDEDLAKTNLPRLVSIMVGDAPLVNEEYVPIYNSYDGRTKTMDSKWANLKKLEEETFAKIITGKVGIDAFDSQRWRRSAEGQSCIDG